MSMKKYNIVVALLLTIAFIFAQAGWQIGKAQNPLEQMNDLQDLKFLKTWADNTEVINSGWYNDYDYDNERDCYTLYITYGNGKQTIHKFARTDYSPETMDTMLVMYLDMANRNHNDFVTQYEQKRAEYIAKWGEEPEL